MKLGRPFKLTEQDLTLIRTLLAKEEDIAVIARRFKISKRTIYYNLKRWTRKPTKCKPISIQPTNSLLPIGSANQLDLKKSNQNSAIV